MQEDQKNKESLVLVIVQELWEDLYQKKVEEIQKEKMKIFATLSHELRTPLNCSISMLEVLKDELQQGQDYQSCIEEYIIPALFSNKLLLNQINDILDFVQMDCGKFKYSFLDFNVINLLKDCSKLVSIQAQMKNLEIRVTFDSKINQIICSDPNRIRQILLNFLSNSLKFTQSGYIELGILSVSKSIYQLYVKDSGIGISHDNQKQIFNFCNKIQYIKKEDEQLNKQGCGLGLIISDSLAKGLIKDESYKGGIFVESEYGKGSKFSILVEDFSNNSLDMVNEQCLDQSKGNKSSQQKADHNLASPSQNQQTDFKSSPMHQNQNFQSFDQSFKNTFPINEISECDITHTEKQDNSISGFIQENNQPNFDKNLNSFRDKKQIESNNNIKNSMSIEITQIINKVNLEESNQNLSSCQVIEDSFNQDMRLELNKIFQIQIHKNFQEDENLEFQNKSNKTPSKMYLKFQSNSSPFQTPMFSQSQQNIDNPQISKPELSFIQQKYQQNQNFQANSDLSNNTDYEFRNGVSEIKSLSKKVSLYQNATTLKKTFQNSKLLIDLKDDNTYNEQEGFTSYASQKQIIGQLQSNQKLSHSSLTNDKIDKINSLKSQISWGKIFDIENNLDQNRNEKPFSTQSIIEEILDFNQNKKKKCSCPQIIIVDDNQFNLYALLKIIQQFQFDVITFSNGDSAIQFIKSQYQKNCCSSPQMIFMDIEMPVKNGYETVKEIIQFYKSVNYTNIPIIIACTAYVGQEDYNKSIEVGMNDFINKPILKMAFQNLILNYQNIFFVKN